MGKEGGHLSTVQNIDLLCVLAELPSRIPLAYDRLSLVERDQRRSLCAVEQLRVFEASKQKSLLHLYRLSRHAQREMPDPLESCTVVLKGSLYHPGLDLRNLCLCDAHQREGPGATSKQALIPKCATRRPLAEDSLVLTAVVRLDPFDVSVDEDVVAFTLLAAGDG